MISPTEEQQKSPLWRIFFISSGMITLFYWNCLLNMATYFDKTVKKGLFVNMTFSYSIGNIISFLTSRFIFKKLKSKFEMFFHMGIASICFTIMIVLVEIFKSDEFKEIICLCLILLFAFFGSAFQGNLSGFSSSCGPTTIVLFNLGLALAGFGSNILAIFFVYLFPTTEQVLEKKNLQRQMISYLIVLSVFVLIYFIILYQYLKHFGHFVNSLDSSKNVTKAIMKNDQILLNTDDQDNFQDLKPLKPVDIKSTSTWKTKNSEPIYNTFNVWTRLIDLWFGIIFNYFITLEIVCYMIPNLTNQYDSGNQYFLLLYLFLYNLGDTLGRMIPGKFNFKNTKFLHLFNFIRGFIQIYFIYIILSTPPKALSHYAFRGAIILLIGISNGFFTNNFFCTAAMRFSTGVNKDLGGFLIIFGLIVGVATGTLSGVLWDIK